MITDFNKDKRYFATVALADYLEFKDLKFLLKRASHFKRRVDYKKHLGVSVIKKRKKKIESVYHKQISRIKLLNDIIRIKDQKIDYNKSDLDYGFKLFQKTIDWQTTAHLNTDKNRIYVRVEKRNPGLTEYVDKEYEKFLLIIKKRNKKKYGPKGVNDVK